MSKYLTDEELELFIRRMEQQELYAPKHMKEQILNRAFSKQTVEVMPGSGSREKPFRFLAYRLKVVAGMAAAIFMLLAFPALGMDSEYSLPRDMEEWEKRMEAEQMQEQDEEKVNVNVLLNEGARQVGRRFNSWFEQMNRLQIENLFIMENGGNFNEN